MVYTKSQYIYLYWYIWSILNPSTYISICIYGLTKSQYIYLYWYIWSILNPRTYISIGIYGLY